MPLLEYLQSQTKLKSFFIEKSNVQRFILLLFLVFLLLLFLVVPWRWAIDFHAGTFSVKTEKPMTYGPIWSPPNRDDIPDIRGPGGKYSDITHYASITIDTTRIVLEVFALSVAFGIVMLLISLKHHRAESKMKME